MHGLRRRNFALYDNFQLITNARTDCGCAGWSVSIVRKPPKTGFLATLKLLPARIANTGAKDDCFLAP